MSTGYRPPSREPKGAWARHLHAFRKAHSWSQTRAFEEWAEGLGFARRSRSAYIAIDMGDRQPTAAEKDYLVSVVGEPTETTPELGEVELPKDAVAIAIEALTAELRLWRQEDRARIGDLEKTVAALVVARPAGERGASQGQPAHPESMGSSR